MWRFLAIVSLAWWATACSTPAKTGSAPVKETCDLIDVDMERGTIKGMALNTEPTRIKSKLPCLTGETTTDRGLQLRFDEHGFVWYADKDVLVLAENFGGRPSQPGISLGDVEVTNFYGTPDREGTSNEAAFMAFNRPYGCVVLLFNDRNKVKQVELHTTPAATVVPIGL